MERQLEMMKSENRTCAQWKSYVAVMAFVMVLILPFTIYKTIPWTSNNSVKDTINSFTVKFLITLMEFDNHYFSMGYLGTIPHKEIVLGAVGDENNKALVSNVMTTLEDKKVVYIYHTHSMESFLPLLDNIKDPNQAMDMEKNITIVGKKLGKALEKRGIGTIVNTTNFTKQVLKHEREYSESYDVSRPAVVEAMKQNKNVQILIDLHRDSFGKKVTTTTINGKKYARTAFVIGAKNPHFKENLEMANELSMMLEKKYPGLNRMILKKKGKGMDGIYNQDLSSRAILIEIGGYENNLEELNRTVEALADVLCEYYFQAEAVIKLE